MNRREFLKCSGTCVGAGVATEFIRCPDPSRVVVAKISRRKVV